MGKFLVGLIVGLIVIPVGVYMYFSTGSAPVATSAAPMPFERLLAGLALHARLRKEMPKPAPIPADEAAFIAGAQIGPAPQENSPRRRGSPGGFRPRGMRYGMAD